IVTQSGCTGSACSTVVVTVPLACSASYTTSVSSTPLTLTFNPAIVPSTATHIWNFGDGTLPVVSSSPVSQQHTFASSGSYDVCLIVQDGLCTDTFCSTVTVLPATGLNDIDATKILQVFPNPAGELVRVALPDHHNESYRLFLTDQSGRILFDFLMQEDPILGTFIDLSLTGLPAGIYGLRVAGNEAVYSSRLTVIK
ncbi:MAG: PKD domain-containing protein, partial [Bacteroidota bacterium]